MLTVAVLMSHYDGDKYVREQIDSILNQKLKPNIKVDLYVRDDGSPSSDLAILKEYRDKGKLTLFEETNVGVKLSFFNLLKEVSGYNFYFFADQDDVWVDNKIQTMIDVLVKYNLNKPVGVYSDLFVADKNAKPTGKVMKKGKLPIIPLDPLSSSKYILRHYQATGASFAINEACRVEAVAMGKDVFEKVSMHDAAIAFMLASIGKLVFIDTPLVYYRQHGNNMIGASNKKVTIDSVMEGKVKKLYEMYIVNKAIAKDVDKYRATQINNIMTKKMFKSPIYMWKLKDYVYGKHKIILQILFIMFGISKLRKYRELI